MIIGGTTKQLPFTPHLKDLLKRNINNIVWIQGSGTTQLLTQLFPEEHSVHQHLETTLNDAIHNAYELAQRNLAHTVLFSPGFTSFEMFDNEFHRGDTFVKIVKDLAENAQNHA